MSKGEHKTERIDTYSRQANKERTFGILQVSEYLEFVPRLEQGSDAQLLLATGTED